MGHKKLERYAAIGTFENVLQYPKDIFGKWHEYFQNNNPITLELACGKGEYSVGLGKEQKDRNFIGIDVKGNRIYIGAKQALEQGLRNVAFLRTQIDKLTDYFAANNVSEIWIVFSDPFLRKPKNRLTHPRFLKIYQQILVPGSKINLKTDSRELYDFTKETIEEQGCVVHEDIEDIYGKDKATGILAIQTFYEKMHLAEGRTIYFISFSLSSKEIIIPKKIKKEDVGAE